MSVTSTSNGSSSKASNIRNSVKYISKPEKDRIDKEKFLKDEANRANARADATAYRLQSVLDKLQDLEQEAKQCRIDLARFQMESEDVHAILLRNVDRLCDINYQLINERNMRATLFQEKNQLATDIKRLNDQLLDANQTIITSSKIIESLNFSNELLQDKLIICSHRDQASLLEINDLESALKASQRENKDLKATCEKQKASLVALSGYEEGNNKVFAEKLALVESSYQKRIEILQSQTSSEIKRQSKINEAICKLENENQELKHRGSMTALLLLNKKLDQTIRDIHQYHQPSTTNFLESQMRTIKYVQNTFSQILDNLQKPQYPPQLEHQTL